MLRGFFMEHPMFRTRRCSTPFARHRGLASWLFNAGFILLFLCNGADAQWKVKWKPPHPHPPPIHPPPIHPPPGIDPFAGLRRALTEAIRRLDGVRSELNSVQGRIRDLEGQLANAEVTLQQLASTLAAVRNNLNDQVNRVADLEGKLSQARTEVVRVKTQLDEAQKQRDNLDKALSKAREAVQAAVGQLLNSQLLAYDITTEGVLSYNMVTNSYYASVGLPGGMQLDSQKIQEWMNGNLSLPKFNPAEMAFSSFGVEVTQTSGYSARREDLMAQNPGASVYLASQRFVDWLSPETIVRMGAVLYGTGGSASDSVISEVVGESRSEFDNLLGWAYLNGVEQLDAFAAAALEALLTQRAFEVDEVKLDFKWAPINYQYRGRLAGSTEMPMKLLPGGAMVMDRAQAELAKAALTPESPHGSFQLVLKGKQGGLEASAQRLIDAKSSDMAVKFDELLTGSVEKVGPIPAPVREFFIKAAQPKQLDQIADRLKELLGIDREFLMEAVKKGNWVVDLRTTPIGKRVSGFIKPLALGNEASSELQALELDLASGRVYCQFLLHHRHSWGTVQEAIAEVNKWAKEKRL